jgi:hypothetical protein
MNSFLRYSVFFFLLLALLPAAHAQMGFNSPVGVTPKQDIEMYSRNSFLVQQKYRVTTADPSANVTNLSCNNNRAITLSAGILKDPAGDANYTGGISYSCTQPISISGAIGIEVVFEDLDTENSFFSGFDYVRITDAMGYQREFYGRALPPTLFFPSDTITIQFITNNNSLVGRGFRLRWRALYKEDVAPQTSPSFGSTMEFNVLNSSLTAGYQNRVPYGNSIALGYNNQSTRQSTVAIGQDNENFGQSSYAFGDQNTLLDNNSFAFGYRNSISGINSIAIGKDNSVNAGYRLATNTMALGTSLVVSGDYAMGLGRENTVSGISALATGYSNTADGKFSTAMGSENTVSGTGSSALGVNNVISGYYSSALGKTNTVSGAGSSALGVNNVISGDYSSALGFNNIVGGGYSRALGFNTTASGNNSTAIGNLVSTAGYNGAMILGDVSTATSTLATAANQLTARFAGGYRFFTNSSLITGVQIGANGTSWATISDSTRKERFLPIDGPELLRKISGMKLTTWNYKQQRDRRHYGPMAQEFFALFGHDALGEIGCDTLITTQDIEGLTLSAVQALIRENEQLKNRLNAVENENIQIKADFSNRLQLLERAMLTRRERVSLRKTKP